MEDSVNTGQTGADGSTTCDPRSTSTNHRNTSGGHNDARVSLIASDGAATVTHRHSWTRAVEDEDDENRDFGEESRPLRLPTTPLDHARMPSEAFLNGAPAMRGGLSRHNGISYLETLRERSRTSRGLNSLPSDNNNAFESDHISLHSDETLSRSDAAVQLPLGAAKNTALGDMEFEAREGLSRFSNSSSSSHVERMGSRRESFPGSGSAASRALSEEEVSVVSAEDDGQFLDAYDGGSVEAMPTVAAPVEGHTAGRREEAGERRVDAGGQSQSPHGQQEPRRSQEERGEELQQLQQHIQGERQQSRLSPLETREHSQHEQQQQSNQYPQQEQVFQGEQHHADQPYPAAEAHRGQGHRLREQQRGAQSWADGAWQGSCVSEGEGAHRTSDGAREGRESFGATEGEPLSSVEAPASQMRPRDVREGTEQQSESEEEEEKEPEGDAAAKSEENSSSEEEDAIGEAHGKTKRSYGCQHYRRRCKVVAPCCGESFWCRHCHNDVKCEQEKDFKKAHEIDRTAVVEVICAVCETRQGVSNECIKCKVEFGKYFCAKCKFWDDKGIKKKVYHCDLCGLCRTGGAESFFHCTTCGSCYSTDIRGSHKCVEKAMHQPCPICCENMFTSIRQVHVLKCGHTLHADCLERLKSECSGMPRLRCPLCFKSLGEYSVFWRRLDEEVARTPLPEELRRRVSCTCNDCAARTDVDYHVVGLKCGACGSYNTREVGP